MTRKGVPDDVAQIRDGIRAALNTAYTNGKKVGDSKFGVYAFYDYDGEPIYVGQTVEKLRTRIRRHLTNHRTDAVAMNVLDPFEVADVEMWPLFDLVGSKETIAAALNAAEFAVFQMALARSRFQAVLNEKDMPTPKKRELFQLPESVRVRIIPPALFEARKHPDVRIARRASTIAALARVISERDVSRGLRRTLVTQAQRLEWLARDRFGEFSQDSGLDEDEGGDE